MEYTLERLTPDKVDGPLLAAVAHPKVWEADQDGCLTRARALAAEVDRFIVVAYLGAEPIGAVEAQDYGPSLWRSYSVIRMHDLFVTPELRRQGVGRHLVEAVIAWAKTLPNPGFIEWQASKPAVAFYESLGFTPDYVSDVPEYPYFVIDLRTETAAE